MKLAPPKRRFCARCAFAPRVVWEHFGDLGMDKYVGILLSMLIAVPAWAQDVSRLPTHGTLLVPTLDPSSEPIEVLPTTMCLADGDPQTQGEQNKKEEVIIHAEKPADDQPVGPYRRPFWTSERPSPTTRLYLQVDPGEVQFEQWVDIRPRQYEGFGQPKVSAVRMSE